MENRNAVFVPRAVFRILTSDKQANEFQIASLESQLKAKEASVAEITARLKHGTSARALHERTPKTYREYSKIRQRIETEQGFDISARVRREVEPDDSWLSARRLRRFESDSPYAVAPGGTMDV